MSIRKIATIREMAAYFHSQAEQGLVSAALVIICNQDGEFESNWSKEDAVRLLGEMEFVKFDIIRIASGMGPEK